MSAKIFDAMTCVFLTWSYAIGSKMCTQGGSIVKEPIGDEFVIQLDQSLDVRLKIRVVGWRKLDRAVDCTVDS